MLISRIGTPKQKEFPTVGSGGALRARRGLTAITDPRIPDYIPQHPHLYSNFRAFIIIQISEHLLNLIIAFKIFLTPNSHN